MITLEPHTSRKSSLPFPMHLFPELLGSCWLASMALLWLQPRVTQLVPHYLHTCNLFTQDNSMPWSFFSNSPPPPTSFCVLDNDQGLKKDAPCTHCLHITSLPMIFLQSYQSNSLGKSQTMQRMTQEIPAWSQLVAKDLLLGDRWVWLLLPLHSYHARFINNNKHIS